MPKPLRQPQPTSSVARLLDLGAAARAVAKQPEPQEVAPRNSTPSQAISPRELATGPTGEIPHIKREFVLTPSADRAFTRLVDLYRQATGTRLTASHVARALFRGVSHCFDPLEQRAKKIGVTKLPSNARGRELERDRFEARIADAFIEGIRASSAMGGDEFD